MPGIRVSGPKKPLVRRQVGIVLPAPLWQLLDVYAERLGIKKAEMVSCLLTMVLLAAKDTILQKQERFRQAQLQAMVDAMSLEDLATLTHLAQTRSYALSKQPVVGTVLPLPEPRPETSGR